MSIRAILKGIQSRRLRFIPLICFAVAIVVMAVGQSAKAAEPLKIRMGYVVPANEIFTLFWEKPEIMKHYKKSYTLELIFFRGTSALISAYAAKEIDFGDLAFTSFPLAITNAGLDLKILADNNQDGVEGYLSEPWCVLADSPIKTIADVRGKVVGTNAHGTAVDLAAQVMLKKNGLVAKRDYNIVEAIFPNQEAMLRERKIDVATFVPPFWQIARAKGGLRCLFTMKDAMGGVTQVVTINARAEFLKQNREVVLDFFEDFLRSWKWVLDPKNRPEVLQLASRFTKRPVSAFEAWYLTKDDVYRSADAIPDIKAFQRNLDILHEHGFMKERFDVSKYVDLSYIQEAKRRLGY